LQKSDTARLGHHGLRKGGREHSPLAISRGALALPASLAGRLMDWACGSGGWWLDARL